MENEWPRVPTSQVAEIFLGGTPSRSIEDYWNGGIKWASARDIANCTTRYIRDTEETISRKGLDNSAAKILDKNTIVITARGTVGAMCMLAEAMAFNQTCYGLKAKNNIDPNYLFYALKSVINNIGAISYGTVFNTITMSSFDFIKIPLPPLPDQHAIAHILGIMDDKIELNRQINQTLETMAQAIFKNWFIDFEPFKNGGMEDSPIGEIPIGWRVSKISNLITLSKLIINPSEHPDEVFDHYSIPAFDEQKKPQVETGEKIRSNKYLVPENSVLISKLNPNIPRVWFPSISKIRRSISSTEFLVTLPKYSSVREYIYSLYNSIPFHETFVGMVTGTSNSHQRVRPDDLLAIDVLMPDPSVIERYSRVVRPILDMVNNHTKENILLESIRNTLLPKLISGEIRIKDAEKFLERYI